jgi:hypothetical protein
MSFFKGEIAILNPYANNGLPSRIGERVVIVEESITSPNYECIVEFDDGQKAPVKYRELNKATESDLRLMNYIFTGNFVHYGAWGLVKIIKVDYLNGQAEIEFNDGSHTVVEINKLVEDDTLPVIDFSKESDSVEEKAKYSVGDKVLTKTNDHFNDIKGEIKSFTEADGGHVYTVLLDNGGEAYFSENELESLEQIPQIEPAETGKFTKIGLDIGQFTDKKNKQYGSSVDATYEMIKVLMERYRNSENTYEIPESLLQHILLQVRMMDKINRIFNNPSGKGDSESPYNDLAGYSLIGIDMVNKK